MISAADGCGFRFHKISHRRREITARPTRPPRAAGPGGARRKGGVGGFGPPRPVPRPAATPRQRRSEPRDRHPQAAGAAEAPPGSERATWAPALGGGLRHTRGERASGSRAASHKLAGGVRGVAHAQPRPRPVCDPGFARPGGRRGARPPPREGPDAALWRWLARVAEHAGC
jgi:hypothetical protein